MLVGCATAASLFPFVGTIVYLIVRPPEYLEDVRERELEIAAAEARLANLEHRSCPYCGFEVEKAFLRCPSCLRRLKEPCNVCGKPLDPRWKICPYCEAEVGPGRRRSRRRRPAAPAARRAAAAARSGPVRPPRPPPASREAGPRAAPAERAGASRAPAPAQRLDSRTQPRENQHGPDPDPGEARRLRARPDRRGHRPLRAQGPDDRRAEAHDRRRASWPSSTTPSTASKPFFGDLVDFITGGPLVAMVLEGHEAVTAARQVIGATNPLEAAPGSIRGDFGARGPDQPRARLGLGRVGRARDRALLPRA